ncbi:MAG: hypothetical protein K6E59_03015 [Bacilli bacterium]|nr:hypothetical protein [Bacilli bacterium]
MLQGIQSHGVTQIETNGPFTHDVLRENEDFLSEAKALFADGTCYHCVELSPFSSEMVSRLTALPIQSAVYVLCPSLPPLGCRILPNKEDPLWSDKRSWDVLCSDLLGQEFPGPHKAPLRPAFKAKVPSSLTSAWIVAKPSPTVPEQPICEPTQGAPTLPSVQEKWSLRLLSGRAILERFKKDGLNPLFAVIFLILGFATALGYFFHGAESNDLFRAACIVMASVFPWMSSIPIGFLYHDSGCRYPHESLFVTFALASYGTLAILLPTIAASVAIGNGIVGQETLLFTLLGLSAIPWSILRLLLEKPIQALRKARKKKEKQETN